MVNKKLLNSSISNLFHSYAHNNCVTNLSSRGYLTELKGGLKNKL